MSNVLVPGAPGPEQQDAPLTEAERKLLVRLFSDPTYFPIEFRTWIKTYLESSDIRLPSSAIVGGNAPKVNLPAGVILPFAGSVIPSNCLLCQGQSLLRADWDLLFQAIGTTWGAVDGTHFSLPDLRDRALYGVGAVVGLAATDGRGLGSRGGPNHKHSFGQTSGGGGDHSHSISGSTDSQGNHQHQGNAGEGNLFGYSSGATAALGSGGTSRFILSNWGAMNSTGAHSHNVSGGTSSGGGHTHFVSGDTSGGYDYDKPSYAGINYIIATGTNV